jgi:hypothetical protein
VLLSSAFGAETNTEKLRAALAAERVRAAHLEAEFALARAKNSDDAATIARQNLEIAKLKRQIYGPRSERTERLLDQMELELEELEAEPPRTNSPPSAPPPRRRTSHRSRANVRSANPSLTTCRASASSFPRR